MLGSAEVLGGVLATDPGVLGSAEALGGVLAADAGVLGFSNFCVEIGTIIGDVGSL